MREPDRAAATLEEVAALGPFFAVATHDAGSAVPPPWRSMGELTRDPAVLRDRARQVRAFLAAAGGRPPEAVEPRVAVSVAQLGLVARLLSPALAVAAVHRAVLPVSLREARWQPVPGGLFPLSLPRRPLSAAGASSAELADRLGAELLDGPVRELVGAARALSVSPRVLWGNVASAVNGAATALAAASPAHAERTRELAALLLERPPLRGACARVAGTGLFRRRSCCLIYRAAPGAAGAVCGDCVLAHR